MRLKLAATWDVGEPIGEGGFGRVYAVTSNDTVAVAKLVPKEPGADRELLFVDLVDIRNVVPIIDRGETEDHWVLVMPKADKSLRQYLTEAGGSLGVSETVSVLIDIATALADLQGRVVHRDLKPENVLLLAGRWCLADFGISRYAEATTAPDTKKYAMTAAYAAPERWRAQRATSAADVYAVGVIGFELLSGNRPFLGPNWEEYRDQHLHTNPPRLDGVPAPLASLVEECLYKAPNARPTPSNLLARLERLARSAVQSSGLTRLQEANRAEVARLGEIARRESEAESDSQARAALVDAARHGFIRISDALKEAIRDAAPTVIGHDIRNGGWSLRLNQAVLRLEPITATAPSPWGKWHAPAFNVVAYSTLNLRIPTDRFLYEGRSHSLWYCDAQEVDYYQWFETAFMVLPFLQDRPRQEPFALSPSENSAKALTPGIAEFQVAWRFSPLSGGDLDEFIDRWATWFADAAQGRLQHPSTIPEHSPNGSWRS